jgi:hypothetical protein
MLVWNGMVARIRPIGASSPDELAPIAHEENAAQRAPAGQRESRGVGGVRVS